MRDSTLLLIAGGIAAAGGFLYWRQRQSGSVGLLAPSGALYSQRAGLPVSGPSPLGYGAGGEAEPALVTIPNAGPSFGVTATRIGTSAGTAIGVAALGPGSIAMAGLTAGIGGAVALLTWAVASKGLFRGGEVGILVNPARDQFLLQFGPGGTGPDSGFGRLAAALTEITGEPNGSHYFQALIGATSKEQLAKATQDIQAVLSTVGIHIGAFEG